VVDPENFFPAEVARYTDFVKGSKRTQKSQDGPDQEILVPGEQEDRTRTRRLKDGVPLPDDTWASILAAARAVGVAETRIQAATA
jgi:hydroxycarboxylate dehydrogenase B